MGERWNDYLLPRRHEREIRDVKRGRSGTHGNRVASTDHGSELAPYGEPPASGKVDGIVRTPEPGGLFMPSSQPDKNIWYSVDIAAMLHRGGPTERDTARPARFAVGAHVRAKTINPPTHTRLPRYVRGHVGTIERVLGYHVFPDSNAHGAGEDPQWLYTVTFEGRELWGDDAATSVKVSIDAFEPYLERA